MTKVRYVTPEGELREVECENGKSVMRSALQHAVPGIVGECGGEMACGTCHVYVGDPWQHRLPPRSEDEIDLLEVFDDVRPESRLSCQITVAPDLDGLTLEIAHNE